MVSISVSAQVIRHIFPCLPIIVPPYSVLWYEHWWGCQVVVEVNLYTLYNDRKFVIINVDLLLVCRCVYWCEWSSNVVFCVCYLSFCFIYFWINVYSVLFSEGVGDGKIIYPQKMIWERKSKLITVKWVHKELWPASYTCSSRRGEVRTCYCASLIAFCVCTVIPLCSAWCLGWYYI